MEIVSSFIICLIILSILVYYDQILSQAATAGRPSDTNDLNNNMKFTHNARLIAMELGKLTPAEIRQYPIADLSIKDMKLVFGYLTPSSITKVLMNIPQEDLVRIQAELTPTYFDRILQIKLTEVEKTQVQDRILLASDH